MTPERSDASFTLPLQVAKAGLASSTTPSAVARSSVRCMVSLSSGGGTGPPSPSERPWPDPERSGIFRVPVAFRLASTQHGRDRSVPRPGNDQGLHITLWAGTKMRDHLGRRG